MNPPDYVFITLNRKTSDIGGDGTLFFTLFFKKSMFDTSRQLNWLALNMVNMVENPRDPVVPNLRYGDVLSPLLFAGASQSGPVVSMRFGTKTDRSGIGTPETCCHEAAKPQEPNRRKKEGHSCGERGSAVPQHKVKRKQTQLQDYSRAP